MVSPPLWVRASWRFFTRHPWQLGLTLLSIALGTAVIVAVDLANMTARQSFGESVSRLSGPMTHEIVAPRGRYRRRSIPGYGLTGVTLMRCR